MGRVIEKVKITNWFDATKSVEIDAIIDTGATMVVLPQNIEVLDLVVDPQTQTLIPNPISPDIPIL